MERDDGETAAWRERSERRIKPFAQSAYLVVYRDAQCLKGLGGWVDLTLVVPMRRTCLDSLHKSACGEDALFTTCRDNRLRNTTCKTIFAVSGSLSKYSIKS